MLENHGEFSGETIIDGIKIQIKGYIVIRDISIQRLPEVGGE